MLIFQTFSSWSSFPSLMAYIQASLLPQALFSDIRFLVPLIFSTLNYEKKEKKKKGKQRVNCCWPQHCLQRNHPFLLTALLPKRNSLSTEPRGEQHAKENPWKIWVGCYLTISFLSVCIKQWELPFLLQHPLKIRAGTPCPWGGVLIKGCLISY